MSIPTVGAFLPLELVHRLCCLFILADQTYQ